MTKKPALPEMPPPPLRFSGEALHWHGIGVPEDEYLELRAVALSYLKALHDSVKALQGIAELNITMDGSREQIADEAVGIAYAILKSIGDVPEMPQQEQDRYSEFTNQRRRQMKKIVSVTEVEGEELVKFLGERITLFCAVYIYTGTLAGVNDDCVLLEDAAIVYETGEFTDKAWKDAQKLPSAWYVQKSMIESFGILKE